MEARAVVLSTPRTLSVDSVGLTDPAAGDIVVAISHSGISTGTEKLLWTGEMPPFPGLGYPLIPGYEAVGTVMEAGRDSVRKPGDRVFVPGANCFEGARGLFGGAASCLVTTAERAVLVDPGHGAEAVLLALAATARHAIAGLNTKLPDLIVGHGTLGRLLARLTIAAGGKPPVVWETNADRRVGTHDYKVIDPADDEGAQYGCIYDASGDPDSLNTLIRHIKKGGEIVLAGFYAKPLSFAFPPAFMKEARIRIAAEWTPDDMLATRMLVESGALSLADLITHTCPAEEASDAYLTAFTDPACLKMILDWGKTA